ncbi:hypothetical protein [Paucibacter sp. XJ19-41]|uniref:hypothetical protein n=1 Tax=Paucibacter sp. XJ19-41 TaxID=2927824 RepID=UPI002348FC09|nr:hypothetical protein [Paucibacter sp. XJ19-41]MDC6168385.1 hypothetical protein [Paucibacter sp. XJ19-41]
MLSITSSDYIAEIASSAYQWPQTTKPFITAIVRNGASDYSLIQTICATSGLGFALGVSFENNTFLTLHCCSDVDGSWVIRRISEVLVGELGGAAVAVFRDDQNIDFCPDAPTVPASQVTGLTLICTSIGHKPVDRSPQVESNEHKLFRGLRHARTKGANPETPAVATVNS